MTSQRKLAFFAGLTLGTMALAQQGPPGPPPGDGGPPNPAEMRQRMTERMKQELGVDDKEWAALESKIDAVRQLRRDASGGPISGPGPGGPGGPGGFGSGPGGPGNGPPPSGNRPQRDQSDRSQGERDQNRQPPPQDPNRQPSAVEQSMRDLRQAIDEDASADQVQAKVTALRTARADAKAKLTKAQEELKELVSARQEAVLVRMGLLE
jgi:hypothetical protein